jgi:farnesyl-diphosphate farnesyltransferase
LQEDVQYCRNALPGVSRTFALGSELLAEPLRDEVAIAYLICRVLDTVEDTTTLPADVRADLLDRAAVDLVELDRHAACAAEIERLFAGPALDGADHALCRNAGTVMRAFHGLRPGAREAMRRSLREMGEGMAATVRRERDGTVLQLETFGDLERYCYYVAGTVGHLLTNLFVLDRASIDRDVRIRLDARAVSFGLGLQVTNIVKNVTDDIARGVAYVPRVLFEQAGIELETLAGAPADPRGRAIVAGLVQHALGWLDDALEYTLALPPREQDLRMFCGLPLAFALRTLARAVATDEVFSEETLKIGRLEVRAIHARMDRVVADDDAVRRLYAEEKGHILDRLPPVRT